MKSSIFLLLLLPVIYISCEDTGPINNVSKCIDNHIKSNPPSCGDETETSVDEYLFQDELVYLFSYENCCCDFSSDILSSSCDTLGKIGGLGGSSVVNGEDWSNAEFIRTVWP